MSEAKMRMEEGEFHRFLAHAYQVMDEFSGNDEDMKKVEGTLASRLGIELVPREEEPGECPFCGFGPPATSGGLSGWRVRCPSCGIRTADFEVFAEAIAAWNRRHQPPPPTIPTREVHLFDGKDLKTITIPTREELAMGLSGEYRQARYATSRHDVLWRTVADAAFRAFGLEPRKEEDHGGS